MREQKKNQFVRICKPNLTIQFLYFPNKIKKIYVNKMCFMKKNKNIKILLHLAIDWVLADETRQEVWTTSYPHYSLVSSHTWLYIIIFSPFRLFCQGLIVQRRLQKFHLFRYYIIRNVSKRVPNINYYYFKWNIVIINGI